MLLFGEEDERFCFLKKAYNEYYSIWYKKLTANWCLYFLPFEIIHKWLMLALVFGILSVYLVFKDQTPRVHSSEKHALQELGCGCLIQSGAKSTEIITLWRWGINYFYSQIQCLYFTVIISSHQRRPER